MKSPLKYTGGPRRLSSGAYQYDTAQSTFNEYFSGLSTPNFFDYDGDGLLDNYPVRPLTPSTREARETNNMFSIPGAIGTYNDAASVNATEIPDQLQRAVMPPGLAGTGTAAATTTEDTFGSRFASNLSSPQAMVGMAKGIGGIIQGLVGRGKRRDAQIAAQEEYDRMLGEYRSLDTSNLYANVENQFTGLENPYEDLTVNRQQAEFEKQMFQQQQSNILQGLQGAAGGSGIAGLAQAMANQGQLQAQRASASIGLQESKINMLRAQEASRLQKLERTGAMQAEQLRLAGAERARGLEYMQTSTQLGMAQQDLAARNRAIAQADAALYGGIGSLVGTAASAAIGGIPIGG